MKPEQKFHEHHEKLISHFEQHLKTARQSPEDSLDRLVEFLQDELLPHAQAEEEVLYREVDEQDPGELATASMRKDHRELEGRIGELAEGGDDSDDKLRRKLDEFSAILLNHFYKEEEILIPFLNEKLSDQEFEDLLSRVHEIEEELN